jgi:ectoine hydroxylase-related dioxygenase (phytanoyl-CoA dioxygenase family)
VQRDENGVACGRVAADEGDALVFDSQLLHAASIARLAATRLSLLQLSRNDESDKSGGPWLELRPALDIRLERRECPRGHLGLGTLA